MQELELNTAGAIVPDQSIAATGVPKVGAAMEGAKPGSRRARLASRSRSRPWLRRWMTRSRGSATLLRRRSAKTRMPATASPPTTLMQPTAANKRRDSPPSLSRIGTSRRARSPRSSKQAHGATPPTRQPRSCVWATPSTMAPPRSGRRGSRCWRQPTTSSSAALVAIACTGIFVSAPRYIVREISMSTRECFPNRRASTTFEFRTESATAAHREG